MSRRGMDMEGQESRWVLWGRDDDDDDGGDNDDDDDDDDDDNGGETFVIAKLPAITTISTRIGDLRDQTSL